MKKIIVTTALLGISLFGSECFNATGKAFSDGQTIRKVANAMDWEISKTASITAATFIKGKVKLYPQDTIQVCLETKNGELQFKAQSSASDAGIAEWRKLPGKRK